MISTLLVTNDFPPKLGGIQSYLWELWQRLDPATTAVLTARSHDEHAVFDDAQAERGLRIERVNGRILFFPTPHTLGEIRAMCAEVKPQLVLLDPVWPLGLLGPRLGLPYGVILHGAELAIPARIPLVRRALAATLSGSAIVISAGGYPAHEAERVAGGALANVVEIPPGVDCDLFRPLDPLERSAARRRLGLPDDALVVASVSRLVPRKGMDMLVEASARLRERYPDLLVAIGGDGRDRSRIERAIRRSGAPVRMLGRITEGDKAALLGSADLFVMACRNRWAGLEQEGFGIVFLEAAAAGVPQLAGESGGAGEAVVDGETGLVVGHPHDPEAVTDALERLLADEVLRRTMGAAGRARAEACFDHATLAPRLAEALARVAG